MVYEVKVTRRGRATIPKALRKKYGIKEGDKLIYQDLGDHVAVFPSTEHKNAPLSECATRGDPKRILEFLNTHEPLSEEDAKAILEASEKGRKSATARKL